jgi:putative molybdopterin biosynthesis protein
MSASGDEFLIVAEIASLLKVNQMTVRSWIARGELPAHRLGRRVRVRRSDFDSFLERTRIEPTQPDGEQSSTEPSGGEEPPPAPKSEPAKRT